MSFDCRERISLLSNIWLSTPPVIKELVIFLATYMYKHAVFNLLFVGKICSQVKPLVNLAFNNLECPLFPNSKNYS